MGARDLVASLWATADGMFDVIEDLEGINEIHVLDCATSLLVDPSGEIEKHLSSHKGGGHMNMDGGDRMLAHIEANAISQASASLRVVKNRSGPSTAPYAPRAIMRTVGHLFN